MTRLATGILILGVTSISLQAQDWKPVAGHIMTRWANRVDPKEPLPEYPRPQMMRKHWVNLNGLWDYCIQPLEQPAPAAYSGKILVPFPVESALSGVKKPLNATERIWYHRTFKAPSLADGRRLLLHFGAVDWETKVFINGQPAGEHRGGYDPFTFDITQSVLPGKVNDLTIAVFDPTGAGAQPDGKQNFNKFAKPGGIAYTASSGIWQTTWLEVVPASYIRDLKMTPDLDAGVLRLKVNANRQNAGAEVVAVAFRGSKEVGRVTGSAGEELAVPVPDGRLWTPEDPFLYTLTVRFGEDSVTSYFAMRKISLGRDQQGVKRILLNGKFVFQAGPLDQGFWPDGLYTAPTDEALRFDVEQMKKLGFNMVRKHLKVEPDRWYYWCDRLGLLVWQDMPCGDGGKAVSKEKDGIVNTVEAAGQFESELKAMVETHYNHPSIVMWIIFNEGWGQYDVPRLTQWVRGLDGSRLINSTSGWHDQGAGDIVDTHSYPGPASPEKEANRAAVLGEFGGLGLGVPGHSWLDTATWGYRSTSGPKELTRKYVELWRKVWQLKDSGGLSAAVYTQLTDVETECNGVLTYDRKILKLDLPQAARAHRGEFCPVATFVRIAPTAQEEAVAWRFTTEEPAADWSKPGFDDSNWLEGPAGFGAATSNGQAVRTPWTTSHLWLRRQFVLGRDQLRNPVFKVWNDAAIEIYINGKLALRSPARNSGYEELDFLPGTEKALKVGLNHIAVRCHSTKPARFVDIGLVREVRN